MKLVLARPTAFSTFWNTEISCVEIKADKRQQHGHVDPMFKNQSESSLMLRLNIRWINAHNSLLFQCQRNTESMLVELILCLSWSIFHHWNHFCYFRTQTCWKVSAIFQCWINVGLWHKSWAWLIRCNTTWQTHSIYRIWQKRNIIFIGVLSSKHAKSM